MLSEFFNFGGISFKFLDKISGNLFLYPSSLKPTKLNIIRITQSCNITDLELPYSIDNFKLPLKITKDIIHSLIEKKINNDEPPFGMYC